MKPIIRTSSSQRLLHAPRINLNGLKMRYTTSPSKDGPARNNPFSQGHANNPSNLHKKDVQSQSVESGKSTRKTGSGGPLDAANEREKKDVKPEDTGMGNPEGIGMVDQVGSASATARNFEKRK